MTDDQIIALFWNRNEEAIRQTDAAYGKKLYVLADKILQNREDTEESVSDTYMQAWNTIPPKRPDYFFAYLAKICRNAALGILERRSAAKRTAEVVAFTQEMERCISAQARDWTPEGDELARLLNVFLDNLTLENRLIFLRRYWYADSIQEIAARYHISQSKVKTQLHRTRNKLRIYLAKEGIPV